MDIASKLYGQHPVIINRGTIGTAMLNISDTAQAIDMGVTFAAAAKLDLTSSSAADAAAGTGARTVEIYGLDFAGNPLIETVTLTGQTIAQTAGSFWRIFVIKVATSGTGRKNAGDIYVVKAGTGGTYTAGVPGTLTSCVLKMLVGINLATSGMWTASRGTSYTLSQLIAQSRVQAGRIQIFHAAEKKTPILLPYPAMDVDVAVSGPGLIPCDGSLIVGELEDVYFKATMAAASGIVSCDAWFTQTNMSVRRY